MAAIDTHALVSRADSVLAKRNWASENVGPMVVFCIVGTVGIFLIILWLYKCMQRRRSTKV
jgi:uncharacterized YccA/Bax inhibitor family protein